MPRNYTLVKALPGHAISFGLNRQSDEQSLGAFLQRFCNDALLNALIPKLDEPEINALVTQLTGLMRNHLSEREYHTLFLDD